MWQKVHDSPFGGLIRRFMKMKLESKIKIDDAIKRKYEKKATKMNFRQ